MFQLNQKPSTNEVIVQLQDAVVTAGFPILGNIFFNVKEEFESSEVYLKFSGREYSKELHLFSLAQDKKNPEKIPQEFTARQDDIEISQDEESFDQNRQPLSNQRQIKYITNQFGALYRVNRNYGIRQIVNLNFLVYQGKLKAGEYRFPLNIMTNDGMPGTFSYLNLNESDRQKQKAKVKYMLRVEIIDVADQRRIIKGAKEITMNNFLIVNQQMREVDGNVVHCFCFQKGTTIMKVFLPKNLFFPKEEIVITIEIDNSRCQAQINTIQIRLFLKYFYLYIRLINRITFIDQNGNETSSRNKLNEVSYFGIAAGHVTMIFFISKECLGNQRQIVQILDTCKCSHFNIWAAYLKQELSLDRSHSSKILKLLFRTQIQLYFQFPLQHKFPSRSVIQSHMRKSSLIRCGNRFPWNLQIMGRQVSHFCHPINY